MSLVETTHKIELWQINLEMSRTQRAPKVWVNLGALILCNWYNTEDSEETKRLGPKFQQNLSNDGM